jgi:hypothetical protein
MRALPSTLTEQDREQVHAVHPQMVALLNTLSLPSRFALIGVLFNQIVADHDPAWQHKLVDAFARGAHQNVDAS